MRFKRFCGDLLANNKGCMGLKRREGENYIFGVNWPFKKINNLTKPVAAQS